MRYFLISIPALVFIFGCQNSNDQNQQKNQGFTIHVSSGSSLIENADSIFYTKSAVDGEYIKQGLQSDFILPNGALFAYKTRSEGIWHIATINHDKGGVLEYFGIAKKVTPVKIFTDSINFVPGFARAVADTSAWDLFSCEGPFQSWEYQSLFATPLEVRKINDGIPDPFFAIKTTDSTEIVDFHHAKAWNLVEDGDFKLLVAYIEKNGFSVGDEDYQYTFFDNAGNRHALITIKKGKVVQQISVWSYVGGIMDDEHFFGWKICPNHFNVIINDLRYREENFRKVIGAYHNFLNHVK